ncbi:MAG: FG-GAP repeat protein [Phycisphaerales bacterium]
MSWNILRPKQPLLGVIIAGGLTVLTSTAPVWGQNESDKVTASDGAANDEFGGRVSIDGDTAIVGAKFNDDGGTDSGSAYIFEQDSVDPLVWNQVTILTAEDDEAGDRFGRSVAISGNVVVVGAVWDDHGGFTDAGSAYIFRFSNGSWTQEAKLTASDAASNDEFGRSVAIDSNVVLIGAPRDDLGSQINAGSAYIFRYSSGSWSEKDKITASDGVSFDNFGFSVSVLDDVALIGMPFDDDVFQVSGAAYIFNHTASDWTETVKLTASDDEEGDSFGWSVALETDVAVVGAIFGGVTFSSTGSAYVFRFDGTDWNEEAELEASEGLSGFGSNVAISGDTIISGTPNHDQSGLTDAGSAWVFHYDGTNWVEEAMLTASDAAQATSWGRGSD